MEGFEAGDELCVGFVFVVVFVGEIVIRYEFDVLCGD